MNTLSVSSMLKHGLIGVILPLVLLSPLPAGCEDSGEPAELTELRRIAESEGLYRAWNYLANLPLQLRLDVARIMAVDVDQWLSGIGIQTLVNAGYPDAAVPALSARVARGDDLTRLGYAWTHSYDRYLVLRMYLKVCRYQLARLDSFDTAQRKNVEEFLSDAGFIPRLAEFSPEAAEQRLAELEAIIPLEHRDK